VSDCARLVEGFGNAILSGQTRRLNGSLKLSLRDNQNFGPFIWDAIFLMFKFGLDVCWPLEIRPLRHISRPIFGKKLEVVLMPNNRLNSFSLLGMN
jgi:hypothetical protein